MIEKERKMKRTLLAGMVMLGMASACKADCVNKPDLPACSVLEERRECYKGKVNINGSLTVSVDTCSSAEKVVEINRVGNCYELKSDGNWITHEREDCNSGCPFCRSSGGDSISINVKSLPATIQALEKMQKELSK